MYATQVDIAQNVLVANLKPLYCEHYDHVGSGLYPFKLP